VSLRKHLPAPSCGMAYDGQRADESSELALRGTLGGRELPCMRACCFARKDRQIRYCARQSYDTPTPATSNRTSACRKRTRALICDRSAFWFIAVNRNPRCRYWSDRGACPALSRGRGELTTRGTPSVTYSSSMPLQWVAKAGNQLATLPDPQQASTYCVCETTSIRLCSPPTSATLHGVSPCIEVCALTRALILPVLGHL